MNQSTKIRLNRIKEQLEVIDQEICNRNNVNEKNLEIDIATEIETIIADIQFMIN